MLIEAGPFKILVDSGLHPKKVGWEATPHFDLLQPDSLDFVILTHCHLDHLGSLPCVVQRHPNVRILTSRASHILAPRMLHNSCNVMLRQRDELGVKEYPLFTHGDVDAMNSNWLPLHTGRVRRFEKHGSVLEVTFYPAGHIVGAVGVLLKFKQKSLFITGDVLFENQLTLPGAAFPDMRVDTLIMETTRGASQRAQEKTRDHEIERLLHTIAHTVDHGGICLMPVFALGRMQEMMALIHAGIASKVLPPIPIYSTGLGMDLVNYCDLISRKTGQMHFSKKITKALRIRPIPEYLKPGKVPREKGLYLISSGMLVENTPSYRVAATIAADHRSTIAYVGYCDPDTPGGKMLMTKQGEPFEFKALSYVANLQAHVERFDLSGHADRDDLLAFAQKTSAKKIVLTHGDGPAREWFAQQLPVCSPDVEVVDPVPGTTYEL